MSADPNANAQRVSHARGDPPLATIRQEARRLLQSADQRGVTIRLLGGVAIALVAGDAMPVALRREYGDIDLVVRREDAKALRTLLEALGYTANQRFNNLHGERRLLFYDETNTRQLDVFVGSFKMCHALDLNARLSRYPATLEPADLLLTKLQIVEINRKDLLDALALLAVCDVVGTSVETIASTTAAASGKSADMPRLEMGRLVDVTSRDWGWYTTLSDNLARLPQLAAEVLPPPEAATGTQRVTAIQRAIAEAPKSVAWRVRAAVGRRMPWYELPEEVGR